MFPYGFNYLMTMTIINTIVIIQSFLFPTTTAANSIMNKSIWKDRSRYIDNFGKSSRGLVQLELYI